MIIATTQAELLATRDQRKRGAVFTMGALHAGHLQLIAKCRELIGDAGQLIVTIFVNPTQFNNPADLEKYPRTFERDAELCSAAGVDVLFAPSVEEMYPAGVELPKMSAGELGRVLEGASRPGHFDAVATVVHRLLSLTDPTVTCFGEKDYQQLVVVRQMVADAKLLVEVVGVPTVLESDGLAMSSRNVRLTADARGLAAQLHQALIAVQTSSDPVAAVVEQRELMASKPGIELDYLVLTDEALKSELPVRGENWRGRVLIAAKVGGVRLIDNLPVVI